MNVLIIGSGGREHALGWKIKQSSRCGRVYFAPGNGGTASIGENVKLDYGLVNTKNADAIDYFCRQNDVGLIVIGPEDPLADGLADRLSRLGRAVFGPVKAAARLEADKDYAKQAMRAASIPTAEFRSFTDPAAALAYVNSRETPVVVKAAGLAKGKGVIVCDSNEQAADAVNQIMVDRAFGAAGDLVIVEERLIGQELSVLALVDGHNIYVLDPSQDHKRIGEGDTGPNTGGMGAFCPTPLATGKLMAQVQEQVLVPIVDKLRREGVVYQGVLYAGLMITAGGPKVLEFNCRFGDPETQPLMMRLRGDLLELMLATAEGRLDKADLDWDPRPCCCVVMASGGYPGSYEVGKPIQGLDRVEKLADVQVFHAGTKVRDGQLVTAGGRVLNVCALGDTLAEAQAKANHACELIQFEGAVYRRDIGHHALNQPSAVAGAAH